MPVVGQGRERFWEFVDIISQRPEKVEDELEEVHYAVLKREGRSAASSRQLSQHAKRAAAARKGRGKMTAESKRPTSKTKK
jgi:hypothetical protein